MGREGRTGQDRTGQSRAGQGRAEHQHGQAIQLFSVIILHDFRLTLCVCSEGSALFHISSSISTSIFTLCLLKIVKVMAVIIAKIHLRTPSECPKTSDHNSNATAFKLELQNE